jgi:hypothetical protein
MRNRFSFLPPLAVLARLVNREAVSQQRSGSPSPMAQGFTMMVLLAVAFIARADDASSQQLVTNSAKNLLALPGLDAEFHYKVQAFGESLAGTGRYLQAGPGPEKLFRLELSTQLEDYKATQTTIAGKQFLWIRRDFGPDQRSLARVSLRRLREAIEEAGPPLAIDPSPTWLGVVSLPKMLGAIGNWFEFEAAQEATLSHRRVLKLRGRMNTDLRTQLLSTKKGKIGEQIPDAIELTLGTDQALPLFPYRIEYLKRLGKDETLTPMLTLDFFSAKVRGEIDLQQFDYFPGDQEVEDRTRLFLERLGLASKDEK